MSRGKPSAVGDTRVAPNGYHYTRTPDGWRATHELVLEQKLGRLLNKATEGCRFVDGDRTNLSSENIELRTKRSQSDDAVRARLEARIEELQAQLADLDG
jgi:hypothetical protein